MTTNRGHTYRERIGPGDAGKTVSGYLAARYRHTSEETWTTRILSGRVRLDGERVAPGGRLGAGQRLTWERPPWVEPDAPTDFAVLHEDDDIVAVAKPAGLPTLPGGGFLERTLLRQLERYRPGLRPLHRLGRHTSGIVACAKSDRGARSLIRLWNTPSVRKVYRALATGSPVADRFRVDVPIGPVPYPPLGRLYAASERGKPSCSLVRVVERRGDRFLCDVEILSGRPHQIRIHLAAAGHPLAGDPLYGTGGVPIEGGGALPGDGGYRLHAMELTLPSAVVRCAPPLSLRTG